MRRTGCIDINLWSKDMDLGLKERVAIVTGAAGGIGAETARILSTEGASIVIADIDGDRATAMASSLEEGGGRAIGVQCDVRKGDQVGAMANKALEAFGRIDVLVNNAGLVRDHYLHKMDEDDWDLVLDVTLKGAYHCCRAVMPSMRERNWGRIINIASRALFGKAGQTNYSSAKAGLQGFTGALAKEQARNGITVNVIAPGAIETDYIKSLPNYEKIMQAAVAAIPVPFLGQPRDIGNAVAYLSSEQARYITGATLFVTGGRYG